MFVFVRLCASGYRVISELIMQLFKVLGTTAALMEDAQAQHVRMQLVAS